MSEKRSATRALLLLLARLDSTRHDARAPRFRAYLFGAQENRAFDRVLDGRVTASRFGSLPDRGLL
jgi:hypothetical protein